MFVILLLPLLLLLFFSLFLTHSLTHFLTDSTLYLVCMLCLTPSSGGLLHEISNIGAKNQFENFLEDLILPAMVGSAQVSTILITFHF